MKLDVLGKILERDKKAVAVVGSRQMTSCGQKLTQDFVTALVSEGYTIISGLARGVDTVAHQTALDCGGRTIAVLGSGLDIVYPPENKMLAQNISQHGAVVSAFPKGTKPLGPNFLARNRLIVELSQAVLVIEGKARSGTLSTASWAGNSGRDVYAIPGSEATDWLIGEGVTAVKDPIDLIALISLT
jgi:DNA processing protein